MPVRFYVDDKQLQAEIRRIRSEFDQKVALETMAQRFLKWVNDNFRSGGRGGLGFGGPGWKPLSPNTRASRPGGQPLRKTGSLAGSFSARVSGNSASAESSHRLAAIHHEGTGAFTIRPVSARRLAFQTTSGLTFARLVRHPGIPARPLVPDEGTGTKIALDTIEKLMEKVFRGR